jgi:hypothetical protein
MTKRTYTKRGISAEDRAAYMREYRKQRPAYEAGGPKRQPIPETPRPTVGPKLNPDYARDYARWRRQQ